MHSIYHFFKNIVEQKEHFLKVKAEGNILNPKKYPDIEDNKLNFVLPCHNDAEEQEHISKMKIACGEDTLKTLKVFKIKHHFNGYFLVFQASLL